MLNPYLEQLIPKEGIKYEDIINQKLLDESQKQVDDQALRTQLQNLLSRQQDLLEKGAETLKTGDQYPRSLIHSAYALHYLNTKMDSVSSKIIALTQQKNVPVKRDSILSGDQSQKTGAGSAHPH